MRNEKDEVSSTCARNYKSKGEKLSKSSAMISARHVTHSQTGSPQASPGTPTVSFVYHNSNRRSTLTLPDGMVMTHSYDDASELAGITYQLGGSTLGNLTYSYDLAGRRSGLGGSYARTGLPLPVSSAVYNANNQLTQRGPSGSVRGGWIEAPPSISSLGTTRHAQTSYLRAI